MCGVSAIVQGVAGIFGASSEAKAGQQQAQIDADNEAAAEVMAKDAEARGAAAEERQREETEQIIGSQRAAIGAANIDISGTALDVIEDTAETGEIEALTVRNNARREAFGFRTKGLDFASQGAMAAERGQNRATGTLLTTAANVSQSTDFSSGG